MVRGTVRPAIEETLPRVDGDAGLRAAIDAALDFALVAMDARGIVTEVSAGAERILGWSRAELVGRPFAELFNAQDRAAGVAERELERARTRGRSVDERWHERKDGSPFWGSGYTYPVTGGGFVKVFQDRTQEVRLEAEIERRVTARTDELEAANAEMESFNHTVSHDLRAPLRAIASTSMILLEESGACLTDEPRELLEGQRKAASRLAALLDELLKMSRLGRQAMERADFDLSALARSTASELKGPCERNGVSVEVADGLRAHGDAKLLRLVLQNYLENACKFSPDGGTIEVGETTVDGERAFYVRDHGVGFDMADAPRLFQPFERLVRDDRFPGTGIGLANVKRIVERHGGRVGAESAPGKGATFWFTLPGAE